MTKRLWIAAVFAALVPLMGRAETDKKTERLWKSKCASCHGADGKGQTEMGKKMGIEDYTSPAWQKAHSDADLKKAVEVGVKREKNGQKQEMEGYKDTLPAEQIDLLVVHVRSLK